MNDCYVWKTLLLDTAVLQDKVESQPAITCSKLTMKTSERRHFRRSGVFIVNYEQVNTGWDKFIYT